MTESPAPGSGARAGSLRRYGISGRWSGDGHRSRVERLEIIALAGAAGIGECPAWLIPLLERGDPDESLPREARAC